MGGKGKRILKIFAWFILSLFLIIIGAGVFVYFKAQPWLIGELSSVVEEKSDGLYDLSLDAIGLKLVPFSIEISGISLQLNEEKSAEILKKSPEKTFYSFQSPEIKINAIALKTLIKNHRFDCKNISIVSPGFELHGEKILRQDSTQFLAPLFNELRPLFKKYLKSISVGEVNFIDADYGLYSSVSDTSHFANAEQVSIAIKKFSTDSAAVFSGTNLFRAGDVLIRMNQFKNDMGDSLHVLCIDSLEFSLKSSDIHASGFHLAPTRVDHSRNRFDVFVPHLYLKSKSATRLAINDSVHVQFLKFEQPRINFYQKENPKHIRIEDINNFNLYSLVKSQFQKIEIDSFFLSGASLNIFRQPDDSVFQQHFKTIDIVLNGFLLDSTSSHNPQKLFHADNLEMNVAGYQLRLDDNQHDFRADSMFVSTVTNSLGVSGITILPTNLGVRTSHTLANISCNRLKIGGVNLKTLYHTRLLPTKDIEITDPKVQLQYQTDIARSAEQKESGLLFQLVSAYLKGVYSEKVNIEGGTLKIQNIKKKKVNGYFQTNFSFNLLKFALDSASIHQTDKFFYASEFDVLFSNYQMKLMDNLHKIDVDSISMSSAGRKVEIKNLHLQPVIRRASAKIMQRFNRSELYHIFVPKIEMKGMNLTDAFFYNKLDINDFKISSPKIYFENFGVLRRKKGSEKFSEFYQLLFNYINDFNIRRITIPDGTFSWINHTRKGKTTSFDNEFSATLNNFRLNENEIGKKRLLFSDDFDITVKDQIFQLSDSVHILRAGDIHLSTNQSKIDIRNAVLYPVITSKKYKELSTTFQVSIPLLEIQDFNFLKAYFSKKLTLTRLELNAPRFQIYSKTGASKSLDLKKYKFPLPSFIQSLTLDELKINNGEVITYETDGINQFAHSNFTIDLTLPNVKMKNNKAKQAQIRTGNVLTKITHFKTPLGKSHDLEIGELNFNREQKTIDITGLRVNPFGQKNMGNQFSVFVPEMNFTDFNINDALTENNFSFDKIEIKNPEVNMNITDSVKGNKLEVAQNLDLFPYVEPYVNKINVNELLLYNASIQFNWFERVLINKRFNLNFKEIRIGKDSKAGNLLNSKEFEISTTHLRRESKNGLYAFTADSLVYNSVRHNLLLTKLKVTPLLGRDEFSRRTGVQTDHVIFSSDFANLQGIDENQWLKDNSLRAEKLVVGPSMLDIYRNKRYPFNHSQRPPWPQDLLKNIKQSFAFDSVLLLPSKVTYSELMDFSDEPGKITFSSLSLKAGQCSNIESNLKKQKNLKIETNALLYNQSPLSATINFDLTSKNYAHTVRGSLSGMPMKPLNAMLEKAAPVAIESGRINRFDFNIFFTDKNASGKLYFGYDNFKISILEFNSDATKRSRFASFWANKMVLNSKNPKGKTLLPVTLFYRRDKERSIINYWWKTILTGSKQTLGINREPKTKK